MRCIMSRMSESIDRPQLGDQFLRRIAAEAIMDMRTVRKWARGEQMRPATETRILSAIERLCAEGKSPHV